MPPYPTFKSPYSSLFSGGLDRPPEPVRPSPFSLPEARQRPHYNFTLNKQLYSMPWDRPGEEPSDIELQQYAFEADQPKSAWETASRGLSDFGTRTGQRLAELPYGVGEAPGTPSWLRQPAMIAGALTENLGQQADTALTSPLGIATLGGGAAAKGLMGATPLVRGIGQVGRAAEMGGGAAITGHGLYGMGSNLMDPRGTWGGVGEGALETVLGGVGMHSAYGRPGHLRGQTSELPSWERGPLPQVSETGLGPRARQQPPRLGPGPGFMEGEIIPDAGPSGPSGPGGLGRGNPPAGPFDAPGTILGEVLELPTAEGIQVDAQTPSSMTRWYQGRRGLAPSLAEAEDVSTITGTPGEQAFNALIPERFKPPTGTSNLGLRGPYDYVPPTDPRQGFSQPGPPYVPPTPQQLNRFPGKPSLPTGLGDVSGPPTMDWGASSPLPRQRQPQIPTARIRSAGEQLPIQQPTQGIGASPAIPDVAPVAPPAIPAPGPIGTTIPVSKVPTRRASRVIKDELKAAKEEAQVTKLQQQLQAVLDKAAKEKLAKQNAVAAPVAEPAVPSPPPAAVPVKQPSVAVEALAKKLEESGQPEIAARVRTGDYKVAKEAVAQVKKEVAKAKAPETRVEAIEPAKPVEKPVAPKAEITTDTENVARVLEKKGRVDLATQMREGTGKLKLKAREVALTDSEVAKVADHIIAKSPAAKAPTSKKAIPEGQKSVAKIPAGEKPTAYENFTDNQVLALARQENPQAITEAHRRRIDQRIRPVRETADDVVRFKKPAGERVKNEPSSDVTRGELVEKDDWEIDRATDVVKKAGLTETREDARQLVLEQRKKRGMSLGKREFRSLSDVGEEGLAPGVTGEGLTKDWKSFTSEKTDSDLLDNALDKVMNRMMKKGETLEEAIKGTAGNNTDFATELRAYYDEQMADLTPELPGKRPGIGKRLKDDETGAVGDVAGARKWSAERLARSKEIRTEKGELRRRHREASKPNFEEEAFQRSRAEDEKVAQIRAEMRAAGSKGLKPAKDRSLEAILDQVTEEGLPAGSKYGVTTKEARARTEGSPDAIADKIKDRAARQEEHNRKQRERRAAKKGTWKFGSQTTEKGFDITSGFDPVEGAQRLYGAAKEAYRAGKKAYKKGPGKYATAAADQARKTARSNPISGEVWEAGKEVKDTGSAFYRSIPDMAKAAGQSGLTTLNKMGPFGRELAQIIQRARIDEDILSAKYKKRGMSDDMAQKEARNKVWDQFRDTDINKKGELVHDWEKLDDLIADTEDPEMARAIVNKHFGRVGNPGDRTGPFVRRAAEIETATKLSQFFISNLANVVMTGSRSNAGAMLKSAGKMMKDYKAAVREAAETGALQPIANELEKELGMSKRVGKWLGIETSEKIQRTFAAIAGKHTANDLFSQVKAGRGGETARRRLKELLLEDDLTDIMKQSSLSEKQVLTAGNRMTEITQGRAGSIDLPPLWTKHPVFNLMTQFKRYAFTQSKNIKDALQVDPIRTIAGLTAGGAIIGEGVGDMKAFTNAVGHSITSNDTLKQAWDKKWTERGQGGWRIAQNYSDAWALGLMLDAFRSFGRGESGGIGFAAGPFAQDVSRAGASLWDEGAGRLQGKPNKGLPKLKRQAIEAIPLFGRGMSQGLAPRNQPSKKRNPMFAID